MSKEEMALLACLGWDLELTPGEMIDVSAFGDPRKTWIMVGKPQARLRRLVKGRPQIMLFVGDTDEQVIARAMIYVLSDAS